jgi:hypothetical protein
VRLIFLNRFFFPDHSATSQMLTDLAFALAAGGHEVHVTTSRLPLRRARGAARRSSRRASRVHRV